MTMVEKITALEKRVAELERQLAEQPDTTFSDYLLKCVIHYQNQMSKRSRPPE